MVIEKQRSSISVVFATLPVPSSDLLTAKQLLQQCKDGVTQRQRLVLGGVRIMVLGWGTRVLKDLSEPCSLLAGRLRVGVYETGLG